MQNIWKENKYYACETVHFYLSIHDIAKQYDINYFCFKFIYNFLIYTNNYNSLVLFYFHKEQPYAGFIKQDS